MSEQTFDIPFKNPNVPAALTADTKIRFSCHKGISCFNACCRHADITLAPYDILRLKTRLGLTSAEFIRQYAVPFQMDSDGLPGLKLRTDDSGACLQLAGNEGCGVYEDRPTVCRYYPVALLALREKGASEAEERYSLVKEEHCKGHDEDREITVADYRAEQGCEQFDELNREWYQLMLKKKSAGPAVGRPPQTSLQLFFLACYDLDNFAKFVQSDNFKAAYDLPDSFYAEVADDQEALLRFGYRLLRQVLFGEHSVPEREKAWESRMEQRKPIWEARLQEEREAFQEQQEAQMRESS
jgi:Fe-S-cluster containining protein